ncbi:acid-sensing ion channel 5-like [Anneissia japonica]|uniref:acid-sensing ion channel 5-like n=1 Tax=Anneissia japonica TaxID=1529436 RepID=UPI0014257F79|nr:acid-sensing ion channel 5-like [Anneissia japonica]
MVEENLSLENEFATSTSLHGLQYISTSKRFIFKLLWALIFLTGFGLCLWQISLRIQEYLLFNVNTEVNLTFVDELEFPALTICNFNRYRNSYLTGNDPVMMKYLQDAMDYDYFSESSYSSSYTSSFKYDSNFTDGNFSTSEFTNRTGFQLNNETILSCKWSRVAVRTYLFLYSILKLWLCINTTFLTLQNFTHLFTSFGNCFTFNSGKYSDVLKVRQPGAGNALQLMIDIQQDEYTESPNGTIEAGLKILVHPQNEPPLIESKGLAVAPGVHAYVSTRRIEVETLGKPHGNCDKSLRLKNYEIYTMAGCLLECRHKHIVNECGCRPIRYPGDEPECTPKETESCASDVLKKLKNGVLEECECPVPCAHTSFSTSVTYAAIPNLSVENELSSFNGTSAAYFSKNYILLDVYYEELNLQVFKQTPAMTFSALLSDIGGQLGLFIGGSVITLFEVGQYFSMKGLSVCCNTSRCTKSKSHPNSFGVSGPASVDINGALGNDDILQMI